ncbi:MAG TPA: hypothetical protein PKE30_18410, partial [Niabella sp.]|nr:hypothetical protein [Niabella sp.]
MFSKSWMTGWVLAVFMLPITFVSCKKEAGERVELIMADPTKVVVSPDEYAERIKARTGFIESITSNETFELHEGVKETHVKLV